MSENIQKPVRKSALQEADHIQAQAAQLGFDWPSIEPVFDKLAEECTELRDAIAQGEAQAIIDEMGDILFVAVNMARKLGVSPEACLREGNAKFTRRFKQMQVLATKRGQGFAQLDLAAQEALWREVKCGESGL